MRLASGIIRSPEASGSAKYSLTRVRTYVNGGWFRIICKLGDVQFYRLRRQIGLLQAGSARNENEKLFIRCYVSSMGKSNCTSLLWNPFVLTAP